MLIFLLLLGVGVVAVAAASSSAPNTGPNGLHKNPNTQPINPNITVTPGKYQVVPALPPQAPPNGDEACSYLNDDPNGEHGRPHAPGWQDLTLPFNNFSGNCLQFLTIPVLESGQSASGQTYTHQFIGYDAGGQWWCGGPFNPDTAKGNLSKYVVRCDEPGTDHRSWLDKAISDVGDVVLHYIVPIAASVATIEIGGVGGVLAATALLAWANIAQGQSLGTAIVNAQRTKLATSDPLSLSAFDQAFQQTLNGLSSTALQKVLQSLPGSDQKDVQQAFTGAVQLARGKLTQDLTVSAMKSLLTGWEGNILDMALKWGGKISTIILGLRGQPGLKTLTAISNNASNFVLQNSTNPDAIKAAIANPVLIVSPPTTSTFPLAAIPPYYPTYRTLGTIPTPRYSQRHLGRRG
jgi:hypothetical protein